MSVYVRMKEEQVRSSLNAYRNKPNAIYLNE
jgi:hypothetical protein